jgi:transposase
MNSRRKEEMSYGMELRERVIGFVLEGNTMQEASKVFKVHYNTISKWLNRYLEAGHINPREPYRQAPYKINWEELEAYVKENPDLTQAEYGEHFGVSQAQICRILKALDITYKKKPKIFGTSTRKS